MSRECALDLKRLKEDEPAYSTIWGLGRCRMLMDAKKYEFYINIRFDTGIEKDYNIHGIHDRRQVHRDLYAGASHPFITFMGR